MNIKNFRWNKFLQFIGARPKPPKPPKTPIPNYTYNPILTDAGPELPPKYKYDPAFRQADFVPYPEADEDEPNRLPVAAVKRFHYLKGPEIAVSSWVVSYALVEDPSDGQIGLLIGLSSGGGSLKSNPNYSGKLGLGQGRRFFGYNSPKHASGLHDFYYPGMGEAEYESLNAAGSKGEWMHQHIVSQKKKYLNVSTGQWGPKGE